MDRVAPSKAKAGIDVEGLAGLLYGIHNGLGMLTGMPQFFTIDGAANARLAMAGAKVWRHFEKTIPSPLMQDIGALAGVAIGVYLPLFSPGAANMMAALHAMQTGQTREPQPGDAPETMLDPAQFNPSSYDFQSPGAGPQ